VVAEFEHAVRQVFLVPRLIRTRGVMALPARRQRQSGCLSSRKSSPAAGARRAIMPRELTVTAATADGVVMAIEHARLPIAAVQFHPESVMTSAEIGHRLVESALTTLTHEVAPP
jgi:GMP synthase-like glutamine amidotransferase